MPELELKVGGQKSVARQSLGPEEKEKFDSAFTKMVEAKSKVDEDIGRSFEENRSFYEAAAEAAKQAGKGLALGGLADEVSSGSIGFREILPQDLGVSGKNSWEKSITSAGWDDLIGSSGSPIKPSNADETCIHAFHALLSYDPDPKILAVKPTIENFPYAAGSREFFSKISKDGKRAKIIPFYTVTPGGIVIQPNSTYYIRAAFEEQGTAVVALLGLCFAKYEYLATEVWR